MSRYRYESLEQQLLEHGGCGVYEINHCVGWHDPELELLLEQGCLQSTRAVVGAPELYSHKNSCHQNVIGFWFNSPEPSVIMTGILATLSSYNSHES